MTQDKTATRFNKRDGAAPEGDAPLIDAPLMDASDRWIWGVWIAAALIAVAILPFASRMGDVARAIASFCGFTIS